jgi:8-oxo-dGTP pyrophosphatase MutT (NUDIX family)
MTLRDAATVLLLRDPLEIFMVKRHGNSGFMAGAYVFPGGKVDDAEDISRVGDVPPLSKTPGRERTRERERAIYAAAIREVLEEARVKIPSAEDLVAWAHWITPSQEPKRFDTHFFLTKMPAGQTARFDEHETTEGAWLSPVDALARHARGELFLPPPTMITLMELEPYATAAEAIAAAKQRTIVPILPKVGSAGEHLAIFMPWDPLYETCEGESMPAPAGVSSPGGISRVVYEETRWVPKRG